MNRIIFIILLAVSTYTMALPKYIYETAPERYFVVRESYLELAMKGEVLSYRNNHKSNYFCVIGLEWHSGIKKIDVFWKDFKQLYYWSGVSNHEAEVFALSMAKGINYETDVVDTQADIGFSSYLMVRSDVEELLQDCEKYGQKFVIKPFKTPEKCMQFDDCKNPLGLRLRHEIE